MNKHEAQCQTIVTHYFTAKPMTCGYEVKYCGDKPFRFSQLEDQQVTSLQNVKHGGYHHKISDESTGHKGFDGFCLKKEKAFVIIFYTRVFVFIDIDIILEHKEKAIDRSLALSLAYKVVNY